MLDRQRPGVEGDPARKRRGSTRRSRPPRSASSPGGLGTKLMGPPRLGPEPEPGSSRRTHPRRQAAPTRVTARRAPCVLGVDHRGDTLSVGGGKPVVPGLLSLGGCEPPRRSGRLLDDRPVFLAHGTAGELRGESAGRLGGLGPDHDPRDRPVEPLDRPQIRGFGRARGSDGAGPPIRAWARSRRWYRYRPGEPEPPTGSAPRQAWRPPGSADLRTG